MRIIGKFRGKSTKDGSWIYGSLLSACRITAIIPCEVLSETPIDYIGCRIVQNAVETESVGTFTGITDNNGKEIYEHDLVRCCGVLREVVYNDELASFVLLEVTAQILGTRPLGDIKKILGLELVGNVFDNAELIAK